MSAWENGAPISEGKLDALCELYGESKAYLRYGEGQSVQLVLARGVAESAGMYGREIKTAADALDAFQRNPAFRRRLPPKPYARVYEHIERMVNAGCSVEQTEEAERLMIDGAYNKLNARDPRDRTDEEMILDIDDAWDWIKEVLGRAGVKGL